MDWLSRVSALKLRKHLIMLTGGLSLILVVVANPMMRSTTNILIINLAVADLLFVIFCKGDESLSLPQKRLIMFVYKHRRSLHRD